MRGYLYAEGRDRGRGGSRNTSTSEGCQVDGKEEKRLTCVPFIGKVDKQIKYPSYREAKMKNIKIIMKRSLSILVFIAVYMLSSQALVLMIKQNITAAFVNPFLNMALYFLIGVVLFIALKIWMADSLKPRRVLIVFFVGTLMMTFLPYLLFLMPVPNSWILWQNPSAMALCSGVILVDLITYKKKVGNTDL